MIYLVNASRLTKILHFPTGLGCIARSLELKGFDFEIIDLVTFPYKERLPKFQDLLDSISHPAIFGFSIIAGNSHIAEVERLAKLVKKANPDHTIIYGGPLPSSVPKLHKARGRYRR